MFLYTTASTTHNSACVADCPDYWLDMSEGDGSRCVNRMDLGSSSCSKEMDFSGSFWTGDDGLCRKSQWARKCDLTWDGVTNNSSACDDSSSS